MSTRSLFKWRHFLPDVILLNVRWYCRYPLSYRDLEEMMQERGGVFEQASGARSPIHQATDKTGNGILLLWVSFDFNRFAGRAISPRSIEVCKEI